MTTLTEFHYSKISKGICEKCGAEITQVRKHQDLPCYHYCCWCCPHSKDDHCPRENEFGTTLDYFEDDTRKQILKALGQKEIFIGYMMLCRYLNGKGYVRYGCNAGYPVDDKSGNAKRDPCPILCPDVNHSLSKIRYHAKKLGREGKLFLKTTKFYDSKNPFSRTSPKMMDVFTFICLSRSHFQDFIKNNTLTRFFKK